MPSGAGSGVNEVLPKSVRGRKGVREGKKRSSVCVCEYMSVCCIRSGQEKQSDQRPRGCMCQACQGSNLWPLIRAVCVCVLDGDECVCLFGSWWNLTGVRSHHIKPITAKQANETNESHEMS